MLRHLRCRIRFSLEIGAILQWAVARMAFYTYRDTDGNLYVRYLYFNDGAWNRNYNWLDNDWNGNNPAALLATLFISLPT